MNADADIELLRALTLMLGERSVSRAAERCGVSQPTMSRTLARLRSLFRDPLLLRSAGGMIPTPRALEIERAARPLIEGFDRLLASGSTFDPATSRRTFVITSPELGERILMPPLLRRLRHEAPDVRLEVRAPEPHRAYEMLESGEVDLRIAWLRRPAASLRSMTLFHDDLVCIAARDHPAVRGTLTLSQFLGLPHARTLGILHATTSQAIDEAVGRLGKRIERAFLMQSFMSVPAALAGTDVLATLPRSQALAFAAQYPLQLIEPPLKLPRIRYAAYWHERSQRDEGHRWLRRALLDASRAAGR